MRRAVLLVCILSLLLVVVFSTVPIASAERYRVFFEKADRDEVKAAVKAKFGDDAIIKELKLVNVMAVSVPPGNIKDLEDIPGVTKVATDEAAIKFDRKPPQPPPPQETPWGVDRIDADLVWATTTGSGIKVAIVDSGIDVDHPDLAGNLMGGINTTGKGLPNSKYDDTQGHGTMCAGVAAAINNDIGVVGVGPDIYLYAVKIAGRGPFYLTDLYEGLDWCIENDMQVISMSFGMKDRSGQPLDDNGFYGYIALADTEGIVLVASAGNDNLRIDEDTDPGNGQVDVADPPSTCHYPASYSQAIAISATGISDGVDYRPDWSNYGPKIDLGAPGLYVKTTSMGGKFSLFSGTSASCPHVSGTAALVLKTFGPLTPDEVRAKLTGTAEYLANLTPEQQGAGLVDAQNAVLGVRTAPPLWKGVSAENKLSITWGKLKGE